MQELRRQHDPGRENRGFDNEGVFENAAIGLMRR
jgi:hypothetical protein